MNNFYDNIGIRIRNLREKNRYTRETFSKMIDISPKFLYEIETGQKGFSADTLYRITRALSVNCEYILLGNESALPQEIINMLNSLNEVQINLISQLLHSIYEIGIRDHV